jgi:hypothetical protein
MYTTFSATMAAATSGQTIEMFADVTESGAVTVQMKDGVNIDGHGHTYTHTGAADAFNDANTAPTVYVTDFYLVKGGSGNGWDTRGITVGYNFVIRNTVDTYAYSGDGGDNAVGITIYSTVATTYVVYLSATSTMSKCYIRNTHASTTAAVYNAGKMYNCVTSAAGTYGVINAGEMHECSTYGASQNVSSTGYSYICISIGVDRGFSGQSGVYNCFGGATGAGGSAFVSCAEIVNCTGKSIGVACDAANGGSMINSTFISTGAAAIDGAGYAMSVRNCIAKSTYNNANGHAIKITGTSTITGCNLWVTHASANALYAASAYNVSYSQNSWTGATTPVNANITQTNANTVDSQGNIKY